MGVNYATANNSALAPGDFVAAAGTLNFAAGVTTQTVTVPVNGDLLDELNETFFVNLSAPSNATLVDSQGLGTITDDDPEPSLSVNDVTVNEANDAAFTVTLSTASGRTVAVDYATADGTATWQEHTLEERDYLQAGGTLTFLADRPRRR